MRTLLLFLLVAVLGLAQAGTRTNAVSGQVISGQRITSTTGPCVFIPPAAGNVTVSGNTIGPCANADGTPAVAILVEGPGAIIKGNTLQMAATGVQVYQTSGATISGNTCLSIFGPAPMGQCVQFHQAQNASASCNVSDATTPGSAVGDHFSVFASTNIQVSRNRMRGGQTPTGSGITIGDGVPGIDPGGWTTVGGNVVVLVPGFGIQVAGGQTQTVRNNLIYQAGTDASSLTYDPMGVRAFSACNGVTVSGNRGIGNRWDYGGTGQPSPPLVNGVPPPACTGYVDGGGNVWGDATLTDAIFNQQPAGC